VLTSAARRRVFGEYQSTEPSRFLDEIPPELVERVETYSGFSGMRRPSPYEMRPNPYAAGKRKDDRVREDTPTYSYEDEDQSASEMSFRPGLRVKHGQFGVGTVMTVEPVDGDYKLQVRFASVGPKTLRAKYARLQPA
jgi:DNA helicase-2/ATP-dependent DNA helicase PcrA